MSRRLLLDSHAFLWASGEPEQLTPEIRNLIESESSRLYLSSATVWELLIKARKRKIDLGGDPAAKLQDYAKRLRVSPVPVSAQHLYQAFELEGLHKDPFDRLLIAQAKMERLTFVTRDQTIRNTASRLCGEPLQGFAIRNPGRIMPGNAKRDANWGHFSHPRPPG